MFLTVSFDSANVGGATYGFDSSFRCRRNSKSDPSARFPKWPNEFQALQKADLQLTAASARASINDEAYV
jgi:hypothetical protein